MVRDTALRLCKLRGHSESVTTASVTVFFDFYDGLGNLYLFTENSEIVKVCLADNAFKVCNVTVLSIIPPGRELKYDSLRQRAECPLPVPRLGWQCRS